jgi:hypothetical protein
VNTTYTFTFQGLRCPFDNETVDTYTVTVEAEDQIGTDDLAKWHQAFMAAHAASDLVTQETYTDALAHHTGACVTTDGKHPPILDGKANMDAVVHGLGIIACRCVVDCRSRV